ncbi:tetratricopeptide repeat protein [Ralstonia solanacearum]|uniref:tetratricopeptide repeat protein n=1 Tax=Ralstonia solanacearum TaxID=305 RepID=UPI000AC58864|nr:tetratricopeptide repeat protein [Ralstonia solanacearum]
MTTETLAHSLAEEVTPATMLQMAGWHAQSGDPAQAERCYRWVLERDPHHVPVLQRLASLLQSDEQRAPEALPLLDAAIALQPLPVPCMRRARSRSTRWSVGSMPWRVSRRCAASRPASPARSTTSACNMPTCAALRRRK